MKKKRKTVTTARTSKKPLAEKPASQKAPRVEQTLRRSHDRLQQQVRNHMAALEKAKQAAEQADASKSRFLAAASHDLRQPLHALGTYAAALKRQLDQPQQQVICDKMQILVATTAELLDRLLMLSQLETGAVVARRRKLSSLTLLDQLRVSYQAETDAKRLAFDIAGQDCWLYSDPELLRRLLDELVANAIRFTDRGGVTISCAPGAERARIAVDDTGKGIPEAEQARIFETYYQLDNPARDRRRSYGLGLALVRQIVDLLELRLVLRSTPGQGSSFSVEVPLYQDRARTDPAPRHGPR